MTPEEQETANHFKNFIQRDLLATVSGTSAQVDTLEGFREKYHEKFVVTQEEGQFLGVSVVALDESGVVVHFGNRVISASLFSDILNQRKAVALDIRNTLRAWGSIP
jgi:hypothetical protein